MEGGVRGLAPRHRIAEGVCLPHHLTESTILPPTAPFRLCRGEKVKNFRFLYCIFMQFVL